MELSVSFFRLHQDIYIDWGVVPIDVHMNFERDVADFLGTEAAILYSQGFSTISSVIPAFCKRGDIIVVDRGVNFAIQKGIQISRSTVRWFDHNDLKSLEEVLEGVEKERRKRRGPLTRRFIVTEGIFEKDGKMVDLPKLVSGEQVYLSLAMVVLIEAFVVLYRSS
jgi:serine palmitoyltransferase